MKYRTLSTSVLRASLAAFTTLGVFSKQRDAIQTELAIRELCLAIEERLCEPACIWTERGGRS